MIRGGMPSRTLQPPVRVSRALAVVGSLLAFVALHALPAGASSGSGAASELSALAESRQATVALAGMRSALVQPALVKYTRGLLGRFASSLTPFEKDLLETSLRFAQPNVRAVLLAGAKGRLTASQAGVLRRLLRKLSHDPAVKLLVAKGRELKRSPSTLAAYLAARASMKPSQLPPQATEGMPRAVLTAASAGPSQELAANVAGVLTEPGVAKYLSANLPPLVLATLTPGTQLAGLTLPRRIVANSASILTPGEHLKLTYWLEVTSQIISGLAQDAGSELVGKGLGTLAGEFVASAAAGPVAGLVGIGFVLWGGYDTWVEAEKTLDKLTVTKLEATPAEQQLPAEAQEKVSVTGINANGENIGPVAFTLSILPDGFCIASACYATQAGKHTIVAVSGEARGYAKLNVTPGPLAHLSFPPTDQDLTLPPGEHSVTYTLEGLDYWLNPISPIAFGPGIGEATLTITEGVCIGDTCIVKIPGVHTVEATVGAVSKTTTLTVAGIKISPTTLPEASEGEPYSTTLRAEGGETPYTWAVTAGTLPAGLSLDPSTGVISGTPTTSDPSSFEMTVTDKNGAVGFAHLTLNTKGYSAQMAHVIHHDD
jgi:hypothetical protein